MGVLRNVPKTFSFEEQRIEINEIAHDLHDLSHANANLTVDQGNPGTASLSYDPATGILSYIPPDFTGYLTTQTVYSVEALLSPGIQLLDDGNAQASNRIFFDGLDGVTIARKSGTTNTIEFSVSLDLEDLGDVTITGADAPADGEALVWDQTAGKWKAQQILMVNVNQFSVENTGTAGNGAGHLDYNQSTGLFTFSPATIPTDVSTFNNDAGYLTALPAHSHSLVDLSDTSLTGGDAPSDGEALVWDQANTTWKAGTISSGWQGNVQNSTTPNGPGAISFDANTNTLWFQPTDIDLILADINNFNNVTITTATITDGDLLTWDQAAWKFLNKQPVKSDWNATAGTIAEILNKPTLVTNINDLGDVDTTGVANGKILKHNGTSWVVADDDTGTSINALNDIGDVNVGGTITDGHVLKWDLATTKWVAGPDLTSSGGSGIALTDISVLKPNPAASGSGDVTYSSVSGAFTYTPPELFSKSYNDLTDKPTIPTNLGDLSDVSSANPIQDMVLTWDGSNWAPDTVSQGALGGLSDVDTTGAANNKILKHNGTSWVVADDEEGGGGILLSNISVVKPNPSASGGGDVTYDNTTGEFTYTPPSIPAAQVKSDWNSTTGLSEILNKPTLFSESYNDLTDKPTLFSGSYNDLTDKPTIPSTLDNLSDVSVGSVSEGKILKYTSGSWSAEDESSSGSSTLSGLSDTSIPGTITTGHVLKWDGSAWGPAADLQGSGGSGIALTDLSVTKPNPSASGSGDVTYNSTSGAFTYTPPEIFSGSYTDLTDKPTIFSGSYNDLTNKPSIPTNNNQLTNGANYVTSSGVTSVIAGTGLSGGTITSTGTIELDATLNELNDVSIGSVVTGQVLKWNGSNWTNQTDATGSSGEQNVQADWNETTTSDDAYIKNKPTLFSGSYNDLTNQPSLFSGSYNDLTNKPTIPAAQIQVDWNQGNTTSLDYIKNKPTIPTIPTNVSTFTNDAGYLTSVGNISLDDLDGVSTSGVANGQVLKYNGSSWSPAADTNYPTGGIGALTDVNWAGGGSPGTNDILQYNGSTWTNATISSGVPSGTIVMYNSGSAPSGWAICNGSNGTPDLRGRFIVGSGGNISGSGGSADAVLIQHSHEYNFTSSGSQAGAHSHSSGNYATDDSGNHSHSQSGSGSGNTGTQSHNHYHTTSQNISIGGGSHSHTFDYTLDDDSNAYGLNIGTTSEGNNITQHGTSNNSHNHNFNFTADTLGVSQDHTHSFNFNISGNTGDNGGHTHDVTGNTNNTGSHGHSFSLGDVSGQHSSVTVSSGNAPGTNKNLPPYYTLTYIMKL